MLEKILIAVDGSKRAEAILTYLRPILDGRKPDDILIATVCAADEGVGYAVPRAGVTIWPAELRAILESYHRRIAAEIGESGYNARGIVETGSPADEIIALARREGVGLVALTTHGRTGIARWRLGSIAEKVLRSCPTPVLLHRSFDTDGNGHWTPASLEGRYVERILVPIDGSPFSVQIIEAVREIANALRPRIDLLHVDSSPIASDIPDVESKEILEAAAAAFDGAGLAVERLVRHGHPAEKILDTADERETDLIAMTTHGRSGVARWLLGSVAEKVTRHANRPVLLVRPPPS